MTALNRTTVHAPAAPVRLVHVGLGAFHRAHQVFYTQKAEADPANPQWGYASFSGQTAGITPDLTAQDGLYTLVTRSGEGDSPELMTALVEARPASDIGRFVELLADPQVAVVTLTVTEAGYHLREDLTLNEESPDIIADLAALRAGEPTPLKSAAGRIVAGLRARRDAQAGGLAVMSCDNIAANGDTTRAAVLGFATALDPDLAGWIADNVTFPSTSIDRITPATTEELVADVARQTGYEDAVPVVTEPFSSWVIQGEFPAGRPAWENAGVEFVADIDPFERRKLWLLNGAHSLLAYAGQLKGYETVDEAIGDMEIRDRVEHLWEDAAEYLKTPGLGISDYKKELVKRFQNPRIRHSLAQIGIDGGTKQRMRAVPILKAQRADNAMGHGAAYSIAAWIAYLLETDTIADTRAEVLDRARRSEDPVAALLAALDEELAADTYALALIRTFVSALTH
ncbi:mannitol dehydrogenase family protein [Corynebacterium comes]|uniref:Mannitol 2-dehydrogenase n=1 Tax=Corynebacterium comes TaxID=2675218 RepID=A0A6B8WFD1_9CORY|nr:mannitol dehydrogenase family protein [Corynebacterium comes]QGU05388.1 Mannitol 2-dehydrogenase [Corynebacterium comes]